MDMNPDVTTLATRRLLRLMYVEQLSRAQVSPHTPPADCTEVPLIVLVGYEGVGKGTNRYYLYLILKIKSLAFTSVLDCYVIARKSLSSSASAFL